MSTQEEAEPTLDAREVMPVVDRLTAIYLAVADARRQLADSETDELEQISATPYIFRSVLPSRLDCVQDRQTGLSYAAWCIGETLGSIGGMDLLHRVFGLFEERHDVPGSIWLDARWNGVGDGAGGLWVS